MLLDEIKKKLITDAAVNLNHILDLEPYIDCSMDRVQICLKIKEAYPIVLSTDKLNPLTREILMLAQNYVDPGESKIKKRGPGRPKKLK